MKSVLRTLLWKWLFGKEPEPIRISKDHLPGLVAPKPAPFTPKRSVQSQDYENDAIDKMYKRFVAHNSGKPKAKAKPKRMDSM